METCKKRMHFLNYDPIRNYRGERNMKSKHGVVVGLSVFVIAVGIVAVGVFVVGLPDVDSGPGHKLARAKSDIRAIATAIDLFHARERRYPTNSEGLGALVPDLLPAVPKGPWGSPFIYRYDGTGMPSLYSSGPNRLDEHGSGDDVKVSFN
jgi:hypothetical protein